MPHCSSHYSQCQHCLWLVISILFGSPQKSGLCIVSIGCIHFRAPSARCSLPGNGLDRIVKPCVQNCTVNVLITKDLKSKPMIWTTKPRESWDLKPYQGLDTSGKQKIGAPEPERGLNLILLTEKSLDQTAGCSIWNHQQTLPTDLGNWKIFPFFEADCLFSSWISQSCWISGMQKAPVDPTWTLSENGRYQKWRFFKKGKKPLVHRIGLRENWNRKAPYLMENQWFSVKIFPTKPMHWFGSHKQMMEECPNCLATLAKKCFLISTPFGFFFGTSWYPQKKNKLVINHKNYSIPYKP